MRGILFGAWLLVALVGSARADRLTDIPEAPPTVSLAERMTRNLTLLGDELGQHINALSFELVDMRFDAKERKARLKLSAGDDEHLSLRVDSRILFRSGYARVHAKIDLHIVGQDLSFELPDFEMVPRSYHGERYVEVRLPLIERRF